MYLDLIWQPKELEGLLELRARELIAQRPIAKKLTLKDIIPRSVNGKGSIEYLIMRTMLRPRDLIIFFNNCIKQASGKTAITAGDITKAEFDYSESRIYALSAEWGVDYPDLKSLILLLSKFPAVFTYKEISTDFQNATMDYLTRDGSKSCKTFEIVKRLYSDKDPFPVYKEITQILYNIGVLGIRNESHLGISWSFKRNTRTMPIVSSVSTLYIHPSLWAYLGVIPTDKNMHILD